LFVYPVDGIGLGTPKPIKYPKNLHVLLEGIHKTWFRNGIERDVMSCIFSTAKIEGSRWLKKALLAFGLAAGVGAANQIALGQDFTDLPSISSSDASICDGAGCDSLFGDGCRANRAKKRGTVGTLFRWSFDPAEGEVAQPDEALISDRPDFTESSTVVGLGVLQVESGYTYTFDRDGASRAIGHSYPETLFRYGILANWLEFRLGQNVAESDVDGIKARGAEDLYLGCKIGLTPQVGWRPEMAIVPQMTVPTGSSSTTSGEVLAGLNWLYSWDLSERISTAGSTQFNRALDETTNSSYTEWAQSWTIGYGLTEKLGGYTEYFGFFPSGADTARTQHYFNGGFTYSFSNDIQWDIRAGKGLNAAADDYFVGTGLVLRFR
jgi:hypothetical protein